MKKFLMLLLVMGVLFMSIGCSVKTNVVKDGDYETFTHWSYGHPAVTTVVVIKGGKQVYANSHASKAVGLELSNDFATMASGLSWGLPFSFIPPNNNIQTQSGGGATSYGGTVVGGSATAFSGSVAGSSSYASSKLNSNITNVNINTNINKNKNKGGWTPPGQDK